MPVASGTFYGASPGQDLNEIVGRWGADSIEIVLGRDVVELVRHLADEADSITMLRRVTCSLLQNRTDQLMSRADVLRLCLDAMSMRKREELTKRLQISDIDSLANLDPTRERTLWRAFLGFFGIASHTSEHMKASLERDTIRPEFGLFPHQRAVADKVCAAIRGGRGRVVLHLPTGAGKTRVVMHVVSRFLTASEPLVVLWLANSAELLDQAADGFCEAWNHLGNREVDLIRFWRHHEPELRMVSDGIVIAGFQKIHNFRKKDPIGLLRLANAAGLVVVDEAHQAIAPTYRDLIETVAETGKHNALLGLTATPGRTWSDISADEELSEFFGKQKVTLEVDGSDDPVGFLIGEGYLSRPSFRRINAAPEDVPGNRVIGGGRAQDYDANLLEGLSRRVGRNVLIVEEIRRLISVGHSRIIVFGATVRHSDVLAAALSATGVDARVVTAETPYGIRARDIRDFRKVSMAPIVMCNCGVLTTGFDAPRASAAVIARPTKSLVLYSQMVGRVTRGPKAGGTETCEISTVVDLDLKGFGNIADAFANWEDVWDG